MNSTIIPQLTPFISLKQIDKIAVLTGFKKRKAKKITPKLFLQSWLSSISDNTVSFASLSAKVAVSIKNLLSKQALASRTSEDACTFLKEVLKEIIRNPKKNNAPLPKVLHNFNRVILQDSTNVSLPAYMSNIFPGSRNQARSTNASLKIQVAYNILNGDFVYFDLTSYRVTDQASSKDVMKYLQPNDLIIRDLGYFSNNVFTEIDKSNAYFITRAKYGVNYWKSIDGSVSKKFNIVQELKKRKKLDIKLLVGLKKKLKARVVAVPVTGKIADERRRRARLDRDKRLNHNKDYYFLLGWEIFITNIEQKSMSSETVAKTYFIRWQIEIIFKIWKSNFSLNKVPNTSPINCKLYIYSKLIHAVIFNYWFMYWRSKMIETGNQYLSLLKSSKLFNLLIINPELLIDEEYCCRFLVYYGSYEKRRRKNAMQVYEGLT